MKNKYLALTFTAATTLLSAQETQRLTVDEAVQLGIENSKLLKIDTAKVAEATAHYLEAKNRQLPDLKASATALALASPTVDLKVMPPRGGGEPPKATQAYMANVNFSWPIFAGGKIKYGIQSAEYLLEAQKYSNENDKISVAYTVAQAYNNLFKAHQSIRLLEENLKAAQQRDNQFLKLENNGIIARNDRLKANLQTNNIEIQLLEAKNNAEIANMNMDLLLGLPENTTLELDAEYIEKGTLSSEVNYYRDLALKNRKDVAALELHNKAATLAIKSAKADKLPTVAITGGYVAANVPNILTITNAANIGVGVQYDISQWWKKDTAEMLARARVQQMAANQEAVNDQIRLQINQDYQNAKLAGDKISLYQKAEEQAAENYRITKNKYDNGLATMTELLDAEAAKIAAGINSINAKADAALALKKLEQTAGILQSTLN